MLHPRYHVPKTYLIKVKGVLTDDEIRRLEQGVRLEDGMTGPAQVKKVRKVEANSWLEITIREGRKHQVKRMLEAVGHSVIKLLRIRMGTLSLGELQPGEFRFLTDREANALRRLVEDRVASIEESAMPAPLLRPQKREGWARASKIKRPRGRGAIRLNR
jgi:23S rRNA pseudouridine2605 synthase